MNELEEMLKTIRFEKFIVRELAQRELEPEDMPLEPVYVNNDEPSENKNLTNPSATELATLAIFG